MEKSCMTLYTKSPRIMVAKCVLSHAGFISSTAGPEKVLGSLLGSPLSF